MNQTCVSRLIKLCPAFNGTLVQLPGSHLYHQEMYQKVEI